MKHILFAAIFVMTASHVQAKDLTTRLGVGYAKPFSIDLPSLALSYYSSEKTNIAVALGIDTKENQSKFGFMLKAFRLIFPEENMNFLMGGGASIISEEISGSSDSGFEVNALAAAEFFFTGLDSLAFRFEAGIGIVSRDDGVTFRTIGNTPMEAGLIFYF